MGTGEKKDFPQKGQQESAVKRRKTFFGVCCQALLTPNLLNSPSRDASCVT